MPYLLHVGKHEVYDKINDYPPFCFPPGEAVEIPDEFIAGKILEHKRLEGLVMVPMKGKKNGFPEYDVEGAKIEAARVLKKAHREIYERYVKDQRENRIRKNFPPLPPSEVVRRIIEEEGYDLAADGINIVGAGFSNPKKEAVSNEQFSLLLESLSLLKEQNAFLKKQLEDKNGNGAKQEVEKKGVR